MGLDIEYVVPDSMVKLGFKMESVRMFLCCNLTTGQLPLRNLLISHRS